jgi:hypothetical protein
VSTKRKLPWVAGLIAVLVFVSGAQAATVNSLVNSVRDPSTLKPVIFEDDNFNMSSQTITVSGLGTVEVITGFINFTAIKRGAGSIPPGEIKAIGGTTPTKSLAAESVEMTGWFAAYVFGFGTDPEGGSQPAAYFAPLPSGVSIEIPIGGGSYKTWAPSTTGTILQLWEDDTPDFDATSPASAYATAINGTWTADVGFKGSASTSADYYAGDEYFVNVWSGAVISGAPKSILGSANFLSVKAGSVFQLAQPNDTGNTFYAAGDNAGSGDNWFWIGDLDAKVMFAPLPSAAWAGFALLGLLGVGRRFRRRNV